VLRWYGLDEGPFDTGNAVRPPRVAGRDVIVALDEDYAVPARFYATTSRRPFVQLERASVADVAQHLAKTHCTSALLVGKPSHFTVRKLDALSEQIGIPWGLLTARDVPGLSFLVAKLLAGARAHAHGFGLIDAIAGRVTEFDSVPSLPTSFDNGSIGAMLRDHRWQTLVVHAHGGNSHAMLRSVVLCGLVDDVEHDLAGRPLAGCRADVSPRRCKRVPRGDSPIVSFGEVRARQLCLLTCSGFSINTEYPSDLGAILSTAEGYPLATVAARVYVSYDVAEPLLFLLLRAQGLDLGPIVDFVNGIVHSRGEGRPYILFGDPAGKLIRPRLAAPGARVELGVGREAVPLTFPENGQRRIRAVEPSARGVRLMAGTSTGALVTLGSPPRRRFRLLDATDHSQAVGSWLADVAQRLHGAAWLERRIRRHYAADLGATPRFVSALAVLSKLRAELEQETEDALELWDHASRRWVWNDDVALRCQRIVSGIDRWNAAMSSLVADHLVRPIYGDALLARMLTTGFRATSSTRVKRTCDSCGDSLQRSVMVDPLGYQPTRCDVSCAHCGAAEVWERGGLRMRAAIPPLLRPGQTASITVRFTGRASEPSTSEVPGLALHSRLVAFMSDKGTRAVVLQRIEDVVAPELELAFAIPKKMTPEVHTLWLAHIDGLAVSGMLRMRRPCLP
jgi:hypothetical protein